jgi:hypothetical protein
MRKLQIIKKYSVETIKRIAFFEKIAEWLHTERANTLAQNSQRTIPKMRPSGRGGSNFRGSARDGGKSGNIWNRSVLTKTTKSARTMSTKSAPVNLPLFVASLRILSYSVDLSWSSSLRSSLLRANDRWITVDIRHYVYTELARHHGHMEVSLCLGWLPLNRVPSSLMTTY